MILTNLHLSLLYLHTNPTPPVELVTTTYEAEDATRSGVSIKDTTLGYSGTGFVDYDSNVGSYIEFSSVNGGAGGACSLSFRYTNGGSTGGRPCDVSINGNSVGTVAFSAIAGEWSTWQVSEALETTCPMGPFPLRLTATTTTGGPNIDYLEVATTPIDPARKYY